jgi:hypothetical protein
LIVKMIISELASIWMETQKDPKKLF